MPDLIDTRPVGSITSLLHQREPRLYLLTAALDALGTGLVLPVTVLFFTIQAGLPPVQLGIGLSIAGACGVAATPVAGTLLDRYGARTVGVACCLVSAAAFASYLLVRDFWTFLPVVCLAQSADRIFRPAKVELAAGLVEPSNRTRLLALQRSLRNAGYGLGGVAATVALATGAALAYQILILGNAASYVLTASLMTRLPPGRRAPAQPGPRRGFSLVLRDRPYVVLTLLNMGLLLHTSALQVGVPLWIVRETGSPPTLIGVLFTLNTVLVIALQVLVSRFADDVRGAARAYAWSAAALLAMSCLFAASAHAGPRVTVVLLVVAVVVLTVGEVFASAGEWGVSLGLAPEEARGRYLALFATGSAAQLAFGPAVVTAVLTSAHTAGWLLLGGVFLATGLAARRVAIQSGRSTAADPSAGGT